MLSNFLKKLLFARQADFTEDEIKILEMQFSLQPMLALVEFQNRIKDKKLFEKFGYLISESMISHLEKRFAIERKKLIDIWTKLFNMLGFGKFELIITTKNRTIIKMESNNFAKLYLKKYGKQEEPVCHILVGIFKNFIEKTSGKKVEVKETSCIASGNKVCTFEAEVV